MTISEQPTQTTLGPVVDGLGPRNRAFVDYLRALYDKNKARGYFTGLRELQEWSATTKMFMTGPVISRILSGHRFPSYTETCHLSALFTGKLPTKKLEGLWRRAAAERGRGKHDIDGQIRDAATNAAVLLPRGVARRVPIVGSKWVRTRTLAMTMATALAVMVIVGLVIPRQWLDTAHHNILTVAFMVAVGAVIQLVSLVVLVVVQVVVRLRLRHLNRDPVRNRQDAD